jgi:hypothetical protein
MKNIPPVTTPTPTAAAQYRDLSPRDKCVAHNISLVKKLQAAADI